MKLFNSKLVIFLLLMGAVMTLFSGCFRTSLKDVPVSDITAVLSAEGATTPLSALTPGVIYTLKISVVNKASGKIINNINLKELVFSSANGSCTVSVNEFFNTATLTATNDTFAFVDGSAFVLSVSTGIGGSFSKDFTWNVDWNSFKSLDYSGSDGSDGAAGVDGSSGANGTASSPTGQNGGNGGNGENGGDGGRGRDLAFEIAFYKLPNPLNSMSDTVMILVRDLMSGELRLFTRQGLVSIIARGGNGGNGGAAGKGGKGGTGYNGYPNGSNGSDGSPGRGGNGGNGGNIEVHIPAGFPLNALFTFFNEGGHGGSSGDLLLTILGANGSNGGNGYLKIMTADSMDKLFKGVNNRLFDSSNLLATVP